MKDNHLYNTLEDSWTGDGQAVPMAVRDLQGFSILWRCKK